jgi:hypothetical protein
VEEIKTPCYDWSKTKIPPNMTCDILATNDKGWIVCWQKCDDENNPIGHPKLVQVFKRDCDCSACTLSNDNKDAILLPALRNLGRQYDLDKECGVLDMSCGCGGKCGGETEEEEETLEIRVFQGTEQDFTGGLFGLPTEDCPETIVDPIVLMSPFGLNPWLIPMLPPGGGIGVNPIEPPGGGFIGIVAASSMCTNHGWQWTSGCCTGTDSPSGNTGAMSGGGSGMRCPMNMWAIIPCNCPPPMAT